MSEAQKRFVSDSARLLARAYAYRESRSNAYVIYNDDLPVGIALYYDCDELNTYDFSQFFIDERYQGKRYGIEAARQILEIMKSEVILDEYCIVYRKYIVWWAIIDCRH